MPIKLVKFFDSEYSNGEKMYFQIGGCNGACGYNISQGLYKTHGDDYLSRSPLWRGKRTNQEWRLYLWETIKVNLPKYLNGKIDLMRTQQWEFRDLMFIALKVADGEKIDLVYLDDLEHAELTKRCLEWLAQQIKF
ncbi:hypothetical protein NG799_01715 [Laspinema sp. D1]|uniref:Uncharacterized protein n=2 Tax=Laspinema TaxID=2584823 RepID=A0ABT2MJZ7_9CYAN|nr:MULTISPECIES: hypothetical protein [unclassified Laspinema]MCT7965048.1 hypothetical protein [Laspinema sp. D2a]MCT7977665.1 hypothetical protein [Laspinema sp. D3b]MCT7992510.1 hypothetical protein [Laspinema sp. D3c]